MSHLRHLMWSAVYARATPLEMLQLKFLCHAMGWVGMKKFFMLVSVIVVSAIYLIAKSQTPIPPPVVKEQSSSPLVETLTTDADTSEKSEPLPVHFYSVEEDGVYGYEAKLSQEDKASGKTSGRVLMVKYLGIRQDGFRKFYWKENQLETVLKCKDPCEFMHTEFYLNGYPNGEETSRVVYGTLAWEMLQDAKAHRLKAWSSIDRMKEPASRPLSSPPKVNIAPRNEEKETTPEVDASAPN